MSTAVEQTKHYCNRYAVFCTGANERGECNTTVCCNSQWLHELLRRGAVVIPCDAEATTGDYPNDLISRRALMEYCSNQKSKSIDNNDIARFPSAEAVHESCEDCPLYDHERHSCPRFNKVIPRTIAEAVPIHEEGTLEIKVPNAQKVGRGKKQ